MAKSMKTPDEISGRDELASVLADSLNKKFKDFKAAHFLSGAEETPTDLTEWVGTGSSLLDLAISNRPDGGFPVGRIIELQGMEASGKSLIVAHTLANTQKKGGLAVYIDTENALSEEFLIAVGVDVKNMLYVPLETIEDAFEAVESIIETVRKSSKDRLVTIAIDSVSAATTKVEQDADYEKDGWATTKAILMSKAMRKITNIIAKQRVLLLCTSQLREKMGVMFGDKYTTSGGKALGFHASCRIRLKGVGKLKSGSGKTEQIIGVQTEAQVIKNRMGPPFKKATFDIYFNSGIDDYNSWLTMMKDHGIISASGAYYTLVNEETGEETRFMSKQWKGMLDGDADLKQYCYKKVCDIYVMKYKDQAMIDPDDVSVDEGELED
jgi:recombination protein RecA|tara:strand:- start:9142 stop:10287 length:1146 start_codon:yes stop_codon:yes gene_type:complete